MLRLIYILAVGLFMVIFIGTGIAVFYPSPKPPQQPAWMMYGLEKQQPTPTQQQITAYETAQHRYEHDMQHYNQNVSIIALVIATVVIGAAVLFGKSLGVLANGILLGDIFTLLYAIARGMTTESNRFRFAVATAGLIATVALGYWRFVKPPETEPNKLNY